jgi:hypothetical protein
MRQVNHNVPGDDPDFILCVTFVLEQACPKKKNGRLTDGYFDDSEHPERERKFGITKESYPNLDIKNLSLEDALALYSRDYYYLSRSLEFPMNVVVFDCAVHLGTKKAAQFLLAAGNNRNDWKDYLDQRLEHCYALYDGQMRKDRNRNIWKQNYLRRINDLKKFIEIEQEKRRM